MQKIKNLAKENQEIKTQVSDQNNKRTEAENSLKAEISSKTTLEAIKDNYDPIIQTLFMAHPIECKYINKVSSIINSEWAVKIKSYFPNAQQNFKLQNIYNGSRDGWEISIFKQKVYNQGPTLIIIKTTQGVICGGYTSKNWDDSNKYTDDINAFVFNMTDKYNPNNTNNAIYTT